MRTLIVGTGGVGGFYGAKLARAGHEVVFTARGRNLEEIRVRGLRLESFEGDITVWPAQTLETMRGVAAFELVLVCVKAQDTEGALEGLSGAIGADTLVVSLQNGVESEELIERLLGLEPMVRGLAYVGVELVAPGVVRHSSGGTILIGERDDRPSERLERLERLLREASIEVVVPQSMARAKWQKLAWNASFNVICALTGATIGGALADPESRSLVEAAMGKSRRWLVPKRSSSSRVTSRACCNTRSGSASFGPPRCRIARRGKPLEHDALDRRGGPLRSAPRRPHSREPHARRSGAARFFGSHGETLMRMGCGKSHGEQPTAGAPTHRTQPASAPDASSMCGRITRTSPAEVIVEQFGVTSSAVVDLRARYNLCPGESVAALIEHGGDRRLGSLRWGLPPRGQINVRSEGVAHRLPVREALRHRRCVILADGFFEWQTVDSARLPHFFRLASRRPFGLAGIWQRGPDACAPGAAILTCAANALVATVHDRMPVILGPDDCRRWLDPGAGAAGSRGPAASLPQRADGGVSRVGARQLGA